MNVVNQAFRIKIAYRSKEKKKKKEEEEEEKETTRDRSVPDGSDNEQQKYFATLTLQCLLHNILSEISFIQCE